MSDRPVSADEQLDDLVDDIPPGGWWNDCTRDTYLEAAKKLVALGMHTQAAIDFLSELWNACASEYGE